MFFWCFFFDQGIKCFKIRRISLAQKKIACPNFSFHFYIGYFFFGGRLVDLTMSFNKEIFYILLRSGFIFHHSMSKKDMRPRSTGLG